jgi:hypothetical protein
MRAWAANLFSLILTAAAAPAFAQSNPVPFLNVPLAPTSVAPGGPDLTLTLNGGGFVPASVANWNGKALTTTFVSGSQLKATVPSADTAAATTASVSVSNPTPGGGTSDVVFFPVHAPVTNVTFTNFPQVSGDFSPGYIGAVGDFNGDGKLDIAGIAPGPPGSGANTIFVALGNGDGSFAAPQLFGVGNEPAGMVAADFNGDGKLDLAVVNISDSTVSVLLGNGDGTFQTQKTFAVPSLAYIVAADFNRDGKLDLATAGNGSSPGVSLLLGNGDGTFQTPIDVPAGIQSVGALGVGDFNRDGNVDLVADDGGTQLSVLLGNGDGTFQMPTVSTLTIPPNAALSGMIVADLNGDSLLDLVIGSFNLGSFLLPGNGDGTFGTATHLDGLGSFPVAVGDFNADGIADIVTDGSVQEIFIGLGNSNGTFQIVSLQAASPALAGDFNGDGATDLASSGSVLPNNSYDVQLQGSFQDFALGESISSLTISPGQNNQLTLYVSPVGGFAQSVNLTCTGAPAGVSCTLSPSSVTLNGTPTQQVQVAVNLSASGSAAGVTQSPFELPPEKVVVFFAFATLLMYVAFGRAVSTERPSRHRPLAVSVLAFSCLFFLGISMVACGGGGGGSNGGNSLTPGTYTVTLNGTSSSGSKMINHSVSFALTVK